MTLIAAAGDVRDTCKGGRPRKYNRKVIVQYLADGKRVREIGNMPGFNFRGVESIVKALFREHDVKTMPQLVAHFLRNGWID